MSKCIDMTGMKFNKFTVIKRTVNARLGVSQWICECECGNVRIVTGGNLRSNVSKSCGLCSRVGSARNLSKTRLNNIWCGFKSRCYNKNIPCFKYYGGRGITVCDKWMGNFLNFYDWAMANGYSDNLTIDRKDNNGNYEPSNCRWATSKQQNRNTTRGKFITHNGKTQSMADWADEFRLSYNTMRYRYEHNWGLEKMLTSKLYKIKKEGI